MGTPQKTRVILYRAHNTINGKCYIGVTERSLRRRIREHVSEATTRLGTRPFYRAIRKYGPDAFKWTVVQTFMFPDDALQAEKDLVAEIGRHRTYNYTPGGAGQAVGFMTSEGRARLSAFHKGKKWALGRKLSEENKEIIRRLGIKNIAKWREYSHLGPKALARRVVCLDTGETYESASAAALAVSVSKSMIIEVCNRCPRRRTAAGLVFRYEGDHLGGKAEADAERTCRRDNLARRPMSLRKMVRCVNDGRVFASASIAQDVYGIHRSFIGEVCRKEKRAARGFVFEYAGIED